MDFLNCKPKHLHFHALQMWANYLETGDPCMSADTAVKCGQKEDVRVLTDDQKRLVLRLRDEASLTLAALLQLNQPLLCTDTFSTFHGLVEEAIGKPVYKHQFANPQSLIERLTA